MSKSIPVAEVKYDPKKWTDKRIQHSATHRAEEYYADLVKEMNKKFGIKGCQANSDQMEEMGRKYVPRGLKTFHIIGNDCRTVAAYFKLVDKIVFDTDFEIIEDTPRRVVLRGSDCPVSSNPQEEMCRDICDYGQGHESVACQIINPAIKFYNPKLMSAGDDSCDLVFEMDESAPLSDVSVPVSLYKLDETVWSLERRLKARQRRGWENLASMVQAINRGFGEEGLKVIQGVTANAANKYVFFALRNHNIPGDDARTLGGYLTILHKIIYGNDLEIIEDTPKKVVLRNRGFCPISTDPKKELKPEICMSYMGHEQKAAEIINPKLKFSVPKLRSAGDAYCEYVAEL